MHEKLRRQVSDICNTLDRRGLCDFRRGIVSVYDRKCGVILIKPDRMSCSEITPIDILAVTDDDRRLIDGEGALPEEFEIHMEIYRRIGSINAIISSNPVYATSFAQTGRAIKPYGTTHAEYFGDLIPCTRKLSPNELSSDYLGSYGRILADTLTENPDWPQKVGAVLGFSDEVYTVGRTAEEALGRMTAIEGVAKLAYYTEMLMKNGASGGTRMQEDLLRMRYERENPAE